MSSIKTTFYLDLAISLTKNTVPIATARATPTGPTTPPLTFSNSSCPIAENPTFLFYDENIHYSFLTAQFRTLTCNHTKNNLPPK
jgi:hypothetical protein